MRELPQELGLSALHRCPSSDPKPLGYGAIPPGGKGETDAETWAPSTGPPVCLSVIVACTFVHPDRHLPSPRPVVSGPRNSGTAGDCDLSDPRPAVPPPNVLTVTLSGH